MREALASWDRLRSRSVIARILSAAVTVALATVLVKLAGMAKVVATAGRFGTNDDLDAYLIAFLAPSFIAESVAGAVSASLVPALVEARERQGPETAGRLFSSITLAAVVVLVAVAAVIGLGGRLLVLVLGSGFTPEKLEVTNALLRLLLPAAVFGGVASVWRAVLNAGEKFALAAISPVLTPLAILAALFAGPAGWGIRALAFGTVAGSALEMVLVSSGLKRQGFSLRPRWYGLDPMLRQVLRQYAPMIAATIVMGASAMVDQAMAATLGAGSVSVLSFGVRLIALLAALGPAVVSTAVFPHFSRLVATGEWEQLRRTLRTILVTLTLVSIPVTIALAVYSEPVVRILLERGAFAQTDTRMVAGVQRLALFQIPCYVLAAPIVRLISAMKANQQLLRAAVIHLASNVVLDYALMRALGVAGIGLATSVVSVVYLCYLLSVLSNQMKARHSPDESEPGGRPARSHRD